VRLTDGSTIDNVDKIVECIGRKPNTYGLGLHEIGVEMTKNGAVITDEFENTSCKNIYAIGDVTDKI